MEEIFDCIDVIYDELVTRQNDNLSMLTKTMKFCLNNKERI